MAVDVAYIVSHGFAARMVTQTDLLKLLRKEGKSVAVICPDQNDPNLRSYCQENDIKLIQFDARRSFGDENYMFKRKYFLEDIEANAALMDKHIHAVRYNASKHPLRRIRPYYYWVMYRLIRLIPFIRKNFIKNERRSLKCSEARKLIAELKPTKIVSTYPVNYNEAVLLYYGNLHPQVETWIHLLSWDNITCKGRFPELADKYITWGDIMTEELQDHYGVPIERIFTCGVPHFDLHFEVSKSKEFGKYVSKLGLNPDKPYLFFGMSSPRFAPGEIEILEWLSQNIENEVFGKIQLVIRPHPQNVRGNLADLSWLPRLRRLQNLKSVAVDFPDVIESKLNWSMQKTDMLKLANLIAGASVVLNSGSTICIDALAHGRPVIITSFDGYRELAYWRSARRLVDYTHLKKLIALGGISVVNSFDKLSAVINTYLNDPSFKAKERANALRREMFDSDGAATLRVREALVSCREHRR